MGGSWGMRVVWIGQGVCKDGTFAWVDVAGMLDSEGKGDDTHLLFGMLLHSVLEGV